MMELTEGLTKEIEKIKEDCTNRIENFCQTEAVLRQKINALENSTGDLKSNLFSAKEEVAMQLDYIKSLTAAAESNTQVRM